MGRLEEDGDFIIRTVGTLSRGQCLVRRAIGDYFASSSVLLQNAADEGPVPESDGE
jgi:hypothetical protein